MLPSAASLAARSAHQFPLARAASRATDWPATGSANQCATSVTASSARPRAPATNALITFRPPETLPHANPNAQPANIFPTAFAAPARDSSSLARSAATKRRN